MSSAPAVPPAPPQAPPRPAAAAPSPQRATAQRAAVQRSASVAADPVPAAEPPLDDLAKRLIGPLSRLLRAELRLDRERIGRLRDPGR
ncbi:hypothetical protein [Streptacidiphilus sp. P02-A3a]|uniref:hypothetical protein n=1 Tax=Streptacidiphilus sp. P02-A3a TaxID=2704468 RepID=UPI0015FA4404|nr:hypothetical protein [Streptacidiphilus sp. P02-A3a]QMU66826.1 hypothetical protein GXP74_25030 [Streptacidiphilus sp. P02-A3a]